MKKISVIIMLLMVGFTFQLQGAEQKSQQLSSAEIAIGNIINQISQGITKEKGTGKIVVAVTKFINLGPHAINQKMGELTSELFVANISKKKQFDLVERENLDKLLGELKLSLLGITNPKLASKVGKMLNAQIFITGAVSDLGENFYVNIRAIDVASAKIIVVAKAKIPQGDVIALSSKYIVRKTKLGALYRSTIMPGWGQIYSEKKVKGTIFTVATLGLAIGGISSYIVGNTYYYNDKYKNATNSEDATTYYDKAKSTVSLANNLFLATGVMWIVNMVDAYISGEEKKEVNVNETSFVIDPYYNNGVRLSLLSNF